ncbi:MAG: pitrilysin family protein [Bacteroidota bacterium]
MDRKTAPGIRTVNTLDIIHPEEVRLANGVSVRIIRAGTEAVCRIEFVFEAGSRYQDAIFQASLTNQMIPEGTPSMTGGEIAEQFEFYGSFFNVSADRDEADLTVHSLEKFLEPVLALTREVLVNPTFPEEELEIIRANRIQSMKVDDQRVESQARKHFNRAIFGSSHPYGIIGEINDIRQVKRSQLQAFHIRSYTPANCRILLTGPHPDQYLRHLEMYFGSDWNHPGTRLENNMPPIMPAFDKRIEVNQPEAVQTAIRIGCPVFGRMHPDFQGLTILNTILGGYFGSRLMSNIREEKGFTYGISSHLLALKDNGYFVIAATVGADVWRQAIDECNKEMTRLVEENVSVSELARIRNYLTGQLQRSVDGPFQLAEQYRTLWINGLDFSYLCDFMDLINRITPKDLKKLAIRYLNPDNMITVAAGPIKT